MNDKAICVEPCVFCDSHDHCSDAHPFNSLEELIKDIKIGKHIPCGVSDKNLEKIRNGVRQAFRTYLRQQYSLSPNLIQIEPTVCEDSEEEEEEDLNLASCEQCGENAWDGYICHSCGMKII